MLDYILNGQGHGDVAGTLLANGLNVSVLRPFYDDKTRRTYVTVMDADGKPKSQAISPAPTTNDLVTNAPGTLRKEEWQILDEVVIRTVKQRLRFVADLRGQNLVYNLPNGMGKTVLQYETQSDISPAIISMDGIRESDRDRPTFDIVNLPLPIIHKDFSFSLREVLVSRNMRNPIDTTTAELAARRVSEEVEKLALGISASYTYGGGTVYGLTNFPSRNTKSLTAPTTSNGTTTIAEVIAMRQQMYADLYFGPFMLYVSPNWDQYLDGDYSTSFAGATLRTRIKQIENIQDIRTLDYLTGNTMILVQMTQDVIRLVMGMEITTLQWPTKGGMELNYKIMCIMVPQVRSEAAGNCGIVHGS